MHRSFSSENSSTTTVGSAVGSIDEYYIPCGVSAVFALIAVSLCIFILILVWRTKPRLHTVNHLLMCNTCCASIYVCLILMNNYAFLIFGQWETSDLGCRWRGYLAYAGVTAVIYSYLIQAISRFFFSILSGRFRWLISFKTHYFLIAIQWVVIFLVASPAIITTDIYFYPKALCWVPFKRSLHVMYTVFAYYVIPVVIIIFIYIYIYCRVKIETRNVRRNSRQTRNLEILRSILILLAIYLGGAAPTLLYQLFPLKIIYLINLAWLTLTVAVEKTCALLLDREVRQVLGQMLTRKTRVTPFSIANPERTGRTTLRSFKAVAKAVAAQSVQTNY